MNKKKIEKIADDFKENLKERNKRAKTSPYLKKMIPIICDCKRRKGNEKKRAKYGVCSCDTYSMRYTLAIVIHNYLQNFLANADGWIVVEKDELVSWDKVKWCAEAIKKYAKADNWDLCSKDEKVKEKYLQNEKDFKEAMNFLIENWNFFWW